MIPFVGDLPDDESFKEETERLDQDQEDEELLRDQILNSQLLQEEARHLAEMANLRDDDKAGRENAINAHNSKVEKLEGDHNDAIAEGTKQLNKKKLKLEENAVKTLEQMGKAAGAAGAKALGLEKEYKIVSSAMGLKKAYVDVKASAAKQPTLAGKIAVGAFGAVTHILPIIQQIKDLKKVKVPDEPDDVPDAELSSVGTSVVGDLSANNAARLGVDPSLGVNADLAASSRVQGESSGSVVFSESRYTEFQSQVEFKEDRTSI